MQEGGAALSQRCDELDASIAALGDRERALSRELDEAREALAAERDAPTLPDGGGIGAGLRERFGRAFAIGIMSPVLFVVIALAFGTAQCASRPIFGYEREVQGVALESRHPRAPMGAPCTFALRETRADRCRATLRCAGEEILRDEVACPGDASDIVFGSGWSFASGTVTVAGDRALTVVSTGDGWP